MFRLSAKHSLPACPGFNPKCLFPETSFLLQWPWGCKAVGMHVVATSFTMVTPGESPSLHTCHTHIPGPLCCKGSRGGLQDQQENESQFIITCTLDKSMFSGSVLKFLARPFSQSQDGQGDSSCLICTDVICNGWAETYFGSKSLSHRILLFKNMTCFKCWVIQTNKHTNN